MKLSQTRTSLSSRVAAIFSVAVLLAATSGASAAIIASQTFNGLDPSKTFNSDTLPIGTVLGNLTNLGSESVAGPGLDFNTLWTDTRGNEGPRFLSGTFGDSSDFVGVNSFTGNNSPNVDRGGVAPSAAIPGEHNFEFNDGDGKYTLQFAPVDVSGNANVRLALNFWINATTWEPGDSFDVSLSDGTTTVSAFNLNNIGLVNFSSADDGTDNWNTVSIDVLALGLGPVVTLTISSDQDSGSENMFVDNVVFSDIPEPSTLTLLGLGAIGLLRRRRR